MTSAGRSSIRVLTEAGAAAVNLGLLSTDGRTLEWVVMEGHPPAVSAEYAGGVAVAERTVATDTARTGRSVVIRSAVSTGAAIPRRRTGSGSAGPSRWSAGRLPTAARRSAHCCWCGGSRSRWTPRSWHTDRRSRPWSVRHWSVHRCTPTRTPVPPCCRRRCCRTVPPRCPGWNCPSLTNRPTCSEVLAGTGMTRCCCPDGRTYLAVGDVVGHGLPAVEDMAQLRSAGRVSRTRGSRRAWYLPN